MRIAYSGSEEKLSRNIPCQCNAVLPQSEPINVALIAGGGEITLEYDVLGNKPEEIAKIGVPAIRKTTRKHLEHGPSIQAISRDGYAAILQWYRKVAEL